MSYYFVTPFVAFRINWAISSGCVTSDRVHDVDVVFDTVGGKMLERSWQVLRKGGKLVFVASQDVPTTFDKLQGYFKEKGDSYGIGATWIQYFLFPKQVKRMKVQKVFINMAK